jgi:hypothetical protein
MPYEGEFAAYRALKRLADTERVQQLLGRAKVCSSEAGTSVLPKVPPPANEPLPEFIVAIDGSNQEVAVKTGYPGAQVGYLTVACVLLDLGSIDRLDAFRPVDPVAFRKTEEAATIDAALPGSNVVTRTHNSAKVAFREELFDVFQNEVIDAQDRVPLLDTYEALLAHKPTTPLQSCPYKELGCENTFAIGPGLTVCPCKERRAVWSTDALRIHERFNDVGSNGEAFGEVMQVWERVLLIHLLRAFERRGFLAQAGRLAFFIDGPLALFGHPAWLSAAISAELERINNEVRGLTGLDLIIVGIEKSGTFVTHFDELDSSEEPGKVRFPSGTYFLPTDSYIKQRIIFSDSPKRYGKDTYFGRKFFYKAKSGARVVASIPFLNASQDTLDSDDVGLYPCFGTVCALLDKLVSCRYPNALAPIVSAHAQAAIPLHLGAKVLEQLAKALMRA